MIGMRSMEVQPERATRAAISCALCLMVLTGGCSTLTPRYEPPEVTIVSVQLVRADFNEQQFRVGMLIRNTNDVDFPVKGMRYRVRFAESDFAHGQTNKNFTIPAHGEADLETMLYTDLMGSLGSLIAWVDTSPTTIDYEVYGTIATGLPVFRNVEFSDKGQVDMEK